MICVHMPAGPLICARPGRQDKLLQKEHFAAAGVPVADFRGVASAADAHAAAADFGFPLMLKSRRLPPCGSRRVSAAQDMGVCLHQHAPASTAWLACLSLFQLAASCSDSQDERVISLYISNFNPYPQPDP